MSSANLEVDKVVCKARHQEAMEHKMDQELAVEQSSETEHSSIRGDESPPHLAAKQAYAAKDKRHRSGWVQLRLDGSALGHHEFADLRQELQDKLAEA